MNSRDSGPEPPPSDVHEDTADDDFAEGDTPSIGASGGDSTADVDAPSTTEPSDDTDGAPASQKPARRRSPLQALAAGVLLPALVSAAVVLVVGPGLLLLDTTPTGFDLGGHVYPLSLADRAIPDPGLPAWSDGWFGGFPLYYFYFPLPALLVWLVGLVAPFNVAVKLVSLSGVLALPFAAYFLARGVGFSRFVSAACVLGAGAFVFMQSYFYLGANLSSTLAGEFSYGIGFTLSLVYLGVVARTARGSPGLGAIAALVLAATALSHILPTAVVVVASLPLLTIRRSQRPVFVSWIVGFMLAGFWTVPFLLRAGLMPVVEWEHVRSLFEVLPREIWPLIPLAVIGAVLTLGKRWAAVALLLPPILGLAFYAVAAGAVHPGRLLPYWFFAVHFLAAVATGGALLVWSRKRTPLLLGVGVLGLAAFALVASAREYDDLRTWGAWNYSGYETKPGWPTLSALVETFQQLPPGRVHWEDSEVIASFGSLNAMTLLPHWSPQHPVTGGLWVESSATAPAWLRTRRETSVREVSRSDPSIPADVGLDLEAGVAHMRLLGARYYVAFAAQTVAEARRAAGLTEVATSNAFTIFEVDGTALVEVADRTPMVHGGSDFPPASSAWFADPTGFGRWLVADGPSAWPRSDDGSELESVEGPYGHSGDPGPVSDLVIQDREISFTTTAIGVPHLVKASWFPNWRTEGALGPYQAAPAFMVVIPNRETVRITFRRSWAEWLGVLLTVLGVLAAISGLLHVGFTWAFLSGQAVGMPPTEPNDPDLPEPSDPSPTDRA